MDNFDELFESFKIFKNSEDYEQVKAKLVAKDQIRRLDIYTLVLDQLLREGTNLIGANSETKLKEWELCVESVLDLWKSSVKLWESDHYSTATALAILTLEETGKLSVERFRLLGIEKIEMTTEYRSKIQEEWKLRKNPFVDHLSKSVMAAMSGALVNARLDRILGMDFVIEFLDLVEGNELESLRQRSLYLDRKGEVLIRPKDLFGSSLSSKYVALAGEVLAEIMPDPDVWEATLKLVKEFESNSGLPYE